MTADQGPINWAFEKVGLGPYHTAYTLLAMWLAFTYMWLPYMVLPIFAGLERIPDSLISASEDLGAKPLTTFRRVVLPLTFPAVVAGSIFTFALTLGDYITPKLVSNNQFIGNVVFNNISNNLPFAAALALVPIVVMVGYLLVARKLGAFEHI
jgi:putative spermidine/putrescine transport system permease protein